MGMKSAKIPYIASLEHLTTEQLRQTLKSEGAPLAVACNNWSADYPYTPAVTAYLAYTDSHLALLFSVEESHVKAVALEDNGRVWEDSCVEFFVGNPAGEGYYNFELNAIGTLLAAYRTSRECATHFSAEQLAQVARRTAFDRAPIDICEQRSWWAVELIPFSLIGLNTLPQSLSANLYKCGDNLNQPHFLSWSPITLDKPNFHCPDHFGTLIFDNE